jgi:hypothetical protein
LAVCLAAACLVLPPWRAGSAAAAGEQALLSTPALPNLLVAQHELPLPTILWELFTWPTESPRKYEEVWYGPPTGEEGTLKTAHYSVKVQVGIKRSPQHAVEAVGWRMKAVATPPVEVSGQQPFAVFSDRAWCGIGPYGGRVIFVRGNVVADIGMGHKEGLEPGMLLGLAALLGRKIDAALAGKPELLPVLPPSAEDMGVGLEGAWEAKTLGARVWKKQATTVALQTGKGLPRALPAKQIAPRDFTVPLGHLTAALGAKGKVKVGSQQARATLAGKAMVVSKGSAEARYGDRTVRLSRPVEFRAGQVLVPLSLIEKALGQRITWGKKGAMILARLG